MTQVPWHDPAPRPTPCGTFGQFDLPLAHRQTPLHARPNSGHLQRQAAHMRPPTNSDLSDACLPSTSPEVRPIKALVDDDHYRQPQIGANHGQGFLLDLVSPRKNADL